MQYSLFSMNEWTFPDRFPESPVTGAVRLKTLRGGSTGFQVRLTGLTSGATLKASFTSTASLGAELFRLLPVYVPVNTGVHGFTADWEAAKNYAVREAPFKVYDAIAPIPDDGYIAGADEGLYVSFRACASLKAGKYSGTLTLAIGAETTEIAVTIDVADAVQPAETLLVTNWYNLFAMARYHGVQVWSEGHWRMIEQYARAMRRIHQNVFWLGFETVIVKKDENGGYSFDFSRTERYVRLFLSLGFKRIEGGSLFFRKSWDAAEFQLHTPDGVKPAMSTEGYTFVTSLLKAYAAFLRENGWYDIAIQHVGDEPHDRAAAEYRILSGIVRKCLPGVPLIEAVETHMLNGAVDIWVPKNDYYERNRDFMEAHRACGDDLWFYTCCIPGGHYANRLLDIPLLRTRMLHWGNYAYRLSGFLHWGLNYWHGDPYTDTAPANGPTNRLPAGDSHILYPMPSEEGQPSPAVIGSMRAEMMKSGTEDYEMLRTLAEKDPVKADAVCSSVFRAFNDCDNDPTVFDNARGMLIDALEEN